MVNILEYQYGSDKGAAKVGETFASPLAYQGMDAEYTSSAVTVKAPSGATGTTGFVADWTPVVSAFNATQGKVLTVEDGKTIKGTSAGDIAEGDTIVYVYNNEEIPVKTPQLKMNIRSIPIVTKSRKLSAIWSWDSQYELSKEYGQDLHQLLATQATAEIEQEIDNEITMDLYRIANAGPEIVWNRMAPTGVDVVTHYDSFYTKVVEGSNQIFAATRRVHANFMVCGLNVSSVLKCMRNFDNSEDLTAVELAA